MENQTKITEFEEYLHNKLISIYGPHKSPHSLMKGSLKFPETVLKVIMQHQISPQGNYPPSFIESQQFYNNFMLSLKHNHKKLDNCYRVTTNSKVPNSLPAFFKKPPPRIIPPNENEFAENYQPFAFEQIDKEALFKSFENLPKEQENLLKKVIKRPQTSQNPRLSSFPKREGFSYDSLQKKHITRIRSAKEVAVHREMKEKSPKIAIQVSQNIKRNTVEVSEKFPAWALERNDFQEKLQSPEFNLKSKILKICEKP